MGWRKLAAEIDISDSTLRGWLHEQRLISERTLRTLLEAKGLAEEEIQRWTQLRELACPQLGLATPADADDTVPGAENASQHDWPQESSHSSHTPAECGSGRDTDRGGPGDGLVDQGPFRQRRDLGHDHLRHAHLGCGRWPAHKRKRDTGSINTPPSGALRVAETGGPLGWRDRSHRSSADVTLHCSSVTK
ncbi:hypothetical protein ACFFQW_13020 [Umezawaea endophytica]|uniref:Helix-turn-helix protein n=1 Tax=Umezawaea endophytica TaxID=1654476 RepID=A0A9X2VL90_9PSEU|nr:hypothetical protein [Umezawaea endophytica]MCS7478743.1 hypothetical protein [Umezawaea endophytica]